MDQEKRKAQGRKGSVAAGRQDAKEKSDATADGDKANMDTGGGAAPEPSVAAGTDGIPVHERHAGERTAMLDRHETERSQMTKRHDKEYSQMAKSHADQLSVIVPE